MQKEKSKNKALTKEEKFVCEMTWGCVPLDIIWIRESKLFIENFNNFQNGLWREIFIEEQKYLKNKS